MHILICGKSILRWKHSTMSWTCLPELTGSGYSPMFEVRPLQLLWVHDSTSVDILYLQHHNNHTASTCIKSFLINTDGNRNWKFNILKVTLISFFVFHYRRNSVCIHSLLDSTLLTSCHLHEPLSSSLCNILNSSHYVLLMSQHICMHCFCITYILPSKHKNTAHTNTQIRKILHLQSPGGNIGGTLTVSGFIPPFISPWTTIILLRIDWGKIHE
jgi:hypothetical protein